MILHGFRKNGLMFMLLGCCMLMTFYSLKRYFNADNREINGNTFVFGREVSSSQTQYKQSVNHIAFIKLPKAGSTTVQNIFLRYGDEKNLTFALPSIRKAGGSSLTSRFFFPPPENGVYDITCTHIRYNRREFSRLLPKDTKYIGTVREPFSHFSSKIRFLRPKSVLGIPGENPVLEYLKKEAKHRNSSGRYDYLCNGMSFYYGFSGNLFLKKNDADIEKNLRRLGNEMDMILVLEYLDESVVLMRRMLNWDLRHVLYTKLRVNKEEDPRLKFGSEEAKLHKSCAYLDDLLYEFFVHKLKELIKRQQSDFYDELAYFRKVRLKYDQFCLSSISNDQQNTEMTFEGSPWNKPFIVTGEHCKKQYIHDVVYIDILKKKQHLHPLL
ncbi:galactose-3-O-sulfotransferase 3-like [Pecten maximus]|uniref:galactose-3-O-sulfotransferase 3-like n=1 Tax=Pecten maximus TaxID=6579 RepID=UPI001458CBFE|nr:galactose-3-O-sulfotransferase 3-like [Pecten maximus]